MLCQEVENYKSQINPEHILEIFSFKDDYNIVSFESIKYEEGNKIIKRNLSDLILRNLFVDLKKFSNNQFDLPGDDITFKNIKI